jgi:NAD(P)-dependent dehydrogenase (short-subunit alcohol dehydrogenase family)
MSDLFAAGATAVITGAASGIGRAAAETFAAKGMNLCLFDADEDGLDRLRAELDGPVRTVTGDVSRLEDVEALRDVALDAFGSVALVMNNAGIGGGSTPWGGLDRWHRILDVNLWGVIHGVHVFAPVLLAQAGRGAIVNTGSKQGITNPPGDPAYAVSKAGVRTLTEQLAHALREEAGDRVTAHLLVPGWTHTPLTGAAAGDEKPAGAWTPRQVVDRMLEQVSAGDFYVICPDNAVSSTLDRLRLQWSVGDMTENRPALSRWHPAWKDAFERFLAENGG